MADRTVNYNARDSTTTLNDTSPIDLGGGGGNSMKFKVGSGFTSNTTVTAQVSKLTLYDWNETEPHQGSVIATWDRSTASTEPFSYLDVATDGNDISVSDTNETDPDTEYDYCFTVTVTDANGNHTTVDPELRVKKKTGL